jgi:putative oxidoreductase
LIFLVFGLNGFLQFIPMPPPTGLAGQYVGALFTSHFLVLVFTIEIVGALMLLVNRHVPLAIVLLGPVIVNILFFHLLMDPSGLGLAFVVVVLWAIVAVSHKKHFEGVLAQRTSQPS